MKSCLRLSADSPPPVENREPERRGLRRIFHPGGLFIDRQNRRFDFVFHEPAEGWGRIPRATELSAVSEAAFIGRNGHRGRCSMREWESD